MAGSRILRDSRELDTWVSVTPMSNDLGLLNRRKSLTIVQESRVFTHACTIR